MNFNRAVSLSFSILAATAIFIALCLFGGPIFQGAFGSDLPYKILAYLSGGVLMRGGSLYRALPEDRIRVGDILGTAFWLVVWPLKLVVDYRQWLHDGIDDARSKKLRAELDKYFPPQPILKTDPEVSIITEIGVYLDYGRFTEAVTLLHEAMNKIDQDPILRNVPDAAAKLCKLRAAARGIPPETTNARYFLIHDDGCTSEQIKAVLRMIHDHLPDGEYADLQPHQQALVDAAIYLGYHRIVQAIEICKEAAQPDTIDKTWIIALIEMIEHAAQMPGNDMETHKRNSETIRAAENLEIQKREKEISRLRHGDDIPR